MAPKKLVHRVADIPMQKASPPCYGTMTWKELRCPEVLRGVARQKRDSNGNAIDKSKQELVRLCEIKGA